MQEFVLSPLLATILFVLFCFAGHRFRRVWSSEGPVWQLWLFGVIAAACLGLVAFVPVVV